MKMTTAYQVGLQVAKTDLSEPSSLRLKIALSEPKAKYLMEILRCAQDHFDAEKMRANLWRCFNALRPF